MSRKVRLWSDNFNDETYNLKFWLISGVENPPTIFTGMGGIHQMPWLSSSCVITSNQVRMPLKPRRCIPESAYTQHMAAWGQTSRWKWRKSDSCPEISKCWQYIWRNDLIFHFSSITVCDFPELKLSWECPDAAITGIISFPRPWPAMLWI